MNQINMVGKRFILAAEPQKYFQCRKNPCTDFVLLKMVISTYFKREVVIKVPFHHSMFKNSFLSYTYMQKWYNCMLLNVIKTIMLLVWHVLIYIIHPLKTHIYGQYFRWFASPKSCLEYLVKQAECLLRSEQVFKVILAQLWLTQ